MRLEMYCCARVANIMARAAFASSERERPDVHFKVSANLSAQPAVTNASLLSRTKS
jgi:hypothetical protein